MTRTAYAPRPATDRQRAFVADLAREVHGENADEYVLAHVESGTFADGKRASALIDSLIRERDAKRAARRERTTGAADLHTPDVPASRYALPALDTTHGSLDFVQVDRPTKGRWAGRTFVVRLIGSPGDFRQVRLPRDVSQDFLRRIASDTLLDAGRSLSGAEAAAVRFSRHFTVCAACLSPLTDDDSRARGLGPVCAKRF
jgi:hypothetical protein